MRPGLRIISDRLQQPVQRIRQGLRDVKVRSDVSRLRGDVLYANLGKLVERYSEEPVGLAGYELKVFSQNGEDGVIAEVLRRLGVTSRTFVEFGIGPGVEGNCVFLADVLGWQGTFIEGDPDLHSRLEAKYAGRDSVKTLQRTVNAENINEILAPACDDIVLDVLSIDIDGNDYWVWRAIDAVDPRLVVIEYNGSLDPREPLVQPYRPEATWNATGFFGASLAALVLLGREKGYSLVHTDLTGTNAFFVKDDLAPRLSDLGPPICRAANYRLEGWAHAAGAGSAAYLPVSAEPIR